MSNKKKAKQKTSVHRLKKLTRKQTVQSKTNWILFNIFEEHLLKFTARNSITDMMPICFIQRTYDQSRSVDRDDRLNRWDATQDYMSWTTIERRDTFNKFVLVAAFVFLFLLEKWHLIFVFFFILEEKRIAHHSCVVDARVFAILNEIVIFSYFSHLFAWKTSINSAYFYDSADIDRTVFKITRKLMTV